MRTSARLAAIALLLVAGLGPAAAQTPADPGKPLELTPQQRSKIHQTVMQERAAKVKTPAPPSLPVAVGAEIPAVTALYDLPDAIQIEFPETKLYKYTVVNNDVVIVDATRMKVVEVIDR